MPKANFFDNAVFSAQAVHKDKDGNIISVQITVPPPAPMKCPYLSCYRKFLGRCITYGLLTSYQTKRVAYAEKHRHDTIPQDIRTGENMPTTNKEIIWAMIKLRFRR